MRLRQRGTIIPGNNRNRKIALFPVCLMFVVLLLWMTEREKHVIRFVLNLTATNTKSNHTLNFYNLGNRHPFGTSNELGPLPIYNYPAGGPVIVTLVSNKNDVIKQLVVAFKSLSFLRGEADPAHPTPILVFHEGGLDPSQIRSILQSVSDRPVAFLPARLNELPSGLLSAHPDWGSRVDRTRREAAKRVRFWVLSLFRHPALADFGTVVRMGPHTCFKNINRQLIETNGRVVYHSQYVGERAPSAGSGDVLYDRVREYVKALGIAPKNMVLWSHLVLAWTTKGVLPAFRSDLEVVDKGFMQRQDVRDFIVAMTEREPYGLFLQGWSDGAIRYMTVMLFAGEEMVIRSNFDGSFYGDRCREDEVVNALAGLH